MDTNVTNTSQARTGTPNRAKRVALWVTLVVLVLAGYGWYSLSQGRVWPYPAILPDHIQRFGNRFDRESGVCHPLSYWNSGSHRIAGIRRIGTIASAIYVGGAPAYSSPSGDKQFTYYTFMLVKNGSCYQYYTGEATG